jgi:hypothetical protein
MTVASQFMVVSGHVEDLADGRTVAPGEPFALTADQLKHPHNQRLIEEEVIAEMTSKKARNDNEEDGS